MGTHGATRDGDTRSTLTADEAAIVEVVQGYFGSWFEGDPERMSDVLHPQLAKRGVRPAGPAGIDADTAESMVRYTAQGSGTRYAPVQRRVSIEVVDIYGSIASVVVTSPVYHEYLHLVREDGGWRILNALWQPTDEAAP